MKTLIVSEGLFFLVSSVKDGHVNETYVFKSDEHKSILDYSAVYELKPANHWAVVDYIALGGLFKDYYEDTINELYNTRDNVLLDFEHTALNESEAFAMDCAKSFMKQYIKTTSKIRKLEEDVKNIDRAYTRIIKEGGKK